MPNCASTTESTRSNEDDDDEVSVFQGPVPVIRYQLRDELRSTRVISDDVRQLLRRLSVEDRNLVVDRNCFALRECSRPSDVEFLVEECSATIFDGGAFCALCSAIRNCDVDRVSLYVEYLMGKRPLGQRSSQQQQQQQQRLLPNRRRLFLTQLFIGNLLPQAASIEATNTADLLFFYGASLSDRVNGGTALEWAVWSRSSHWVRYLVDKGAISPTERDCPALRLAAILGDEDVFQTIVLQPNLRPSCREEATALWDAANMIASGDFCDLAVPAQRDRFLGQWVAKLLAGSTSPKMQGKASAEVEPDLARYETLEILDRLAPIVPFRKATNAKLKTVMTAAAFIRHAFGGRLPPFFANNLLAHSCTFLARFDATTSDIVDLLLFVMSTLDVYVFSSRYSGQQDLIRLTRSSRNDLDLGHLSRLFVAYAHRQLRCVEVHQRLHDWPSAASTLLELALHNTTPALSEAVARLETPVHRAAVLAVAVDLWRCRFSGTARLEELVRALIDQGSYVGLSGMLVYDDTPVSATRLRRDDPVGRLIHETACCQLNYPNQCMVVNPPVHWRIRSLKCLAAHRLNRCLGIDQYKDLPDVLIQTRGMLIPLPYLVDSHNAGQLRSQRLRRPAQPLCACAGLVHGQLLDTSITKGVHR